MGDFQTGRNRTRYTTVSIFYSTIVMLPIPSSPATAFALSHEDRVSSLRVNIGQLAILVIHHHFALILQTIPNTIHTSIPDKQTKREKKDSSELFNFCLSLGGGAPSSCFIHLSHRQPLGKVVQPGALLGCEAGAQSPL